MKTLNRKDLLAVKVNVPRETVEVPELGGAVVVRGMTGREQTALYKMVKDKTGKVNEELFAARLIIACLVDKDGNKLLEDTETELVLGWPGTVVQALSQASMRVNGLSERGNLSATDGEGSSSG